ncbi:MAG: mechanosensitive ion channel [Clostridia bacterium]|nr:mechanosensitive ion channel [Clostridia bacterium]
MFLFMAGETAAEPTFWEKVGEFFAGVWEHLLKFFKTPIVGRTPAEWCIRVVVALAILIIGCIVVKRIAKNIENGKLFKKVNKTVRVFLKHLISVALYLVVAVAIISTLGFNMTALSAVIASCGLAIGLALQGGLSNIAGGVMLVIFKPFEIGDYVESSGVSGTVVDIGLFYSTLTTPDNKKVVVPNGTISNNVITNYSAHDTRRIDFDFSISYSANIDTARKVLYACAKADEKILQDPLPEVMIVSHNESGITIRLRVWVKNADYWDVYFPMYEQVKRSFDEYGVEIPYPHLNITIDK